MNCFTKLVCISVQVINFTFFEDNALCISEGIKHLKDWCCMIIFLHALEVLHVCQFVSVKLHTSQREVCLYLTIYLGGSDQKRF